MKEWEIIRSVEIGDLSIFKARYDFLKNPRNNKEVKVTVLQANDAVNVVALTTDNKILFINQFRFGTRAFSLEVPGGFIEKDEIPLVAAKRELQEETGYTAPHWEYLGAVYANPVFMDSKIHHFVAHEATLTDQLALDEAEDIEVILLSKKDLKELVTENKLKHPHTLSALSRIFNLFSTENL